jgi:uncharacterized damage-inducible protein DinB
VKRRIWFERTFELGLPPEVFPEILERLRGTPARVENLISVISAKNHRVEVSEGSWSIQENVGHLLDLEPLWDGRLDDLEAGETDLRPADLTNRKTHDARHHDVSIHRLLTGFRTQRSQVVQRLEGKDETDLVRTALHPRLRQPMTVVDLFFFVAEHDDHHLATISALATALKGKDLA